MIRSWLFCPRDVFALTHVAPIHRAIFCIQPYLDSSKRVVVQCLAPAKLKQCFLECRIQRFLLLYRYFREFTFQIILTIKYNLNNLILIGY